MSEPRSGAVKGGHICIGGLEEHNSVLRDQTGRTNWKASGCMRLSCGPCLADGVHVSGHLGGSLLGLTAFGIIAFLDPDVEWDALRDDVRLQQKEDYRDRFVADLSLPISS